MSNVYMTGYQMTNVAQFLENLNTLNKDTYLYDMTIRLTGPVVNSNDETLGRVIFSVDEDAYVFIPGLYETYDV